MQVHVPDTVRPNKLKHEFGAEKDLSKGPSEENGWLVMKKLELPR